MGHARRIVTVPIAALIVTLATLAGARFHAQAPVRDLRREPPGTSVIAGRVETDETNARPLRRAQVRLTGDRLMTARMTTTTDDGSFQFGGLPSGQYQLSASRSTYMAAEYGARRPGGVGSAIVLTDGERRANLVLRLSRFAAIRGTVYDPEGAPAVNISVEALKYTMRTGRRTLSSVYGQPSYTDDEGQYDLGGLSPGEYFVAAGPSPRDGPIALQRLTVADVDRALQLFKTPATPAERLTFAERAEAFAPVYFPGTTNFSQAQSITLVLGEQRAGVDLRLQLIPTARIDGTLWAPDGQPVTSGLVQATATTEAQSMDLFNPQAMGSASLDAQGRFTFPALAPGRYVLSARVPALPGMPANQGPFWAMAAVTVSGADQSVSLTLQPGLTVSGLVVFDGALALPPNFAGLRVNMPNADGDATLAVPAATIAADGTFRISGAPPARYRLTASTPPSPPGWAPRSAVVGQIDAFDLPFEIAPGRNVDDVVITFSDRPAELSGTLQTTDGAPTADYFIVVLAADRRYWVASARRNTMARPASTGRYIVRNLPAGEYFVAAVTDVEFNQWMDSAFLEQLVPAATRITIGESEKKTLDLRVGRR
jgi:hypothetical protein